MVHVDKTKENYTKEKTKVKDESTLESNPRMECTGKCGEASSGLNKLTLIQIKVYL